MISEIITTLVEIVIMRSIKSVNHPAIIIISNTRTRRREVGN